jgi:hypothetical protein
MCDKMDLPWATKSGGARVFVGSAWVVFGFDVESFGERRGGEGSESSLRRVSTGAGKIGEQVAP